MADNFFKRVIKWKLRRYAGEALLSWLANQTPQQVETLIISQAGKSGVVGNLVDAINNEHIEIIKNYCGEDAVFKWVNILGPDIPEIVDTILFDLYQARPDLAAVISTHKQWFNQELTAAQVQLLERLNSLAVTEQKNLG